jgi:hypothetical protein
MMMDESMMHMFDDNDEHGNNENQPPPLSNKSQTREAEPEPQQGLSMASVPSYDPGDTVIVFSARNFGAMNVDELFGDDYD